MLQQPRSPNPPITKSQYPLYSSGVRLVAVLIAAALFSASAAAFALSAVEGQQPEAMSLLGKPLVPPALSGDAQKDADAELARARAAYDADPHNADAILAVARATARIGRITDALSIYTRGVEAFPDDARFYVERGHYYVVIRKFDVALKDFRKAAESQPEVKCDAGVASYLKGDFNAAREALHGCGNAPWPYLADLRAHATPAQPHPPSGDALVNAYVPAAQQLAAGRTDKARDLLKTIVEKNRGSWMEPIYIAAEADYAKVAKLKRRPSGRR